MKTSKYQRQAAFARYKASPSATPESMADLAVAVGAAGASERDAWRDRFAADFSGTRAAMWATHTAAGPITPATPATAVSGPSVAAGSDGAASAYPSALARAVERAQRVAGGIGRSRPKGRAASAAGAMVSATTDVAAPQPKGGSGFYSKDVQPSAFAAAQEAARVANQQRMAAEQRARGIA